MTVMTLPRNGPQAPATRGGDAAVAGAAVTAFALSAFLAERVTSVLYLGADAVARWTAALVMTADVPGFRAATAGTYPVVPLLADGGLGLFLPGGWPIPVLANLAAISILAALWCRMLVRAGHGGLPAAAIALTVVLAPPLQYAVAAGAALPLGLLAMTGLAWALVRLRGSGEIDALIAAGLCLAVLFLTDAAGLYLVLGLLPFLAVLLPAGLVGRSTAGGLVALFFPLGFAILALLYLNGVLAGSAFAFAVGTGAAARGAADDLAGAPWLLGPAARLPGLLPTMLIAAIAAAPLLALLAVGRGGTVQRAATALLAVGVVTGLGLAALARFPDHPLRLLAYLAPLAILAAGAAGGLRFPMAAAILGLAGWAGGWAAMTVAPTPDMVAWRAALLHREAPVRWQADLELAATVGQARPLAIDPAAAGAVLVAFGATEGLVFPHDPQLKADLLRGRTDVAMVAVRDPDTAPGRLDRIGRALPDVYREGPPGGTLLYDQGGWRVWRQPVRNLPQAGETP